LQKGDKIKSVGAVKLNLGDYIRDRVTESENIKMILEKCPDKEAYVQFKVKATLIKETFNSSDALS
jgi:uncharacterized Fe-S center protein